MCTLITQMIKSSIQKLKADLVELNGFSKEMI